MNLNKNKITLSSVTFKELSKEDVKPALAFQSFCYEKIMDKETYVPETEEELILGATNGLLLGAFFDDELVGTWNLIPYGENEESYGFDLGFDFDKRKRLINFESAIVKDEAQGIGIDKKAVSICVEKLKNRFDYFACTVSPKNLPSLKAMIKNGFFVYKFKLKYGGKERFVLLRDETLKETKETTEKLFYKEKESIINLLESGYIITSACENNNFIFSKLK